MNNLTRPLCSLSRSRMRPHGCGHDATRRYFNHTVYQVPSYVRKLNLILPQITAFSNASNDYSQPVLIKADLTDSTRQAWLAVGHRERENIKSGPNPYFAPALIKWFRKSSNTFRIPVRFSNWFEKKAAIYEGKYPMEIIRPARHVTAKGLPRHIYNSSLSPNHPDVEERQEQSRDSGVGSESIKEVFVSERLSLNALTQAFSSHWAPPFSIYMAQVPIDELPHFLRDELPTPYLLAEAADAPADIYGTSVWMGSEPTYTSLHRDPNPNYFLQLCGRKHIRLLRPKFGHRIYDEIRRSIGGGEGRSRMRGTEMMTGPEKTALEAAIWGDWFEDGETPGPGKVPRPSEQVLDIDNMSGCEIHQKMTEDFIWEAVVDPGDALFIPLGWWHSVRSSHADARLNASANWWFRYREGSWADRPRPTGPPRQRDKSFDPRGRKLGIHRPWIPGGRGPLV